jgi:RimJ/RimL family protein N-acetyltransferase
MTEHDIRWSQMEDLPHLEKWFLTPETCNAYPFGFEERGDALKNWIGFSRYRASLTATIDNTPCAIGTLFLMPYKKVAHHCSFYLIVAPEHRRKGIGRSMVRNLIHLAKSQFRLESIHAEIFEPSVMVPLLKQLNFETFATQENYIKINGTGHSRILMEHFIP